MLDGDADVRRDQTSSDGDRGVLAARAALANFRWARAVRRGAAGARLGDAFVGR